MSSSHCYVGYNLEMQMFYLMDHGSSGNGSSNGTYVKVKDSIIELKKDKNSIRILRELPHEQGKKRFVDYQIDCTLPRVFTIS